MICNNQYDEFLFFNCSKNSTHLKIMVPGLRGPAGGPCKSGDITGWGLKCNFLNENIWIPIKISLKFVPKGPMNNIPEFVQIMAWHRTGDKPLSELMMTRFNDAYMRHPASMNVFFVIMVVYSIFWFSFYRKIIYIYIYIYIYEFSAHVKSNCTTAGMYVRGLTSIDKC